MYLYIYIGSRIYSNGVRTLWTTWIHPWLSSMQVLRVLIFQLFIINRLHLLTIDAGQNGQVAVHQSVYPNITPNGHVYKVNTLSSRTSKCLPSRRGLPVSVMIKTSMQHQWIPAKLLSIGDCLFSMGRLSVSTTLVNRSDFRAKTQRGRQTTVHVRVSVPWGSLSTLYM